MTAKLRAADAAMCDRTFRLLNGNGLPLTLLERVLDLPADCVTAVGHGVFMPLSPLETEKLELFCAIMTRLEIRLGYEPRDVRKALATPLAALGHETASATIAIGIEGLRAVHRAVAEIALPAERWWRIAPRR